MSHFSALFVVLPAVGFGVTAYVTTVAMRRPSGNIDPALGKAMRDRRLVFLQQAALPAILGFVLWFLTLRLDSSVGPAVDALALGFGLASLGTTVAPSLFYAARLPGLWKAPQGFGRVLTVAVLPETNVLFAFVIGDLLIGRLRDPT
ncbi:MAG TPA: hypothetical protein VJ397_10515, partial [Thermoplasmata archaeon]|nr:hypothetical protein [Thermoplasmata archaeon]